MIRFLATALLLLSAPALADERRVNLGSFSKLRVQGAFDLTVAVGGSPGAVVIGERAVIGDVDLHAEGETLTVRRPLSGRWTEQAQGSATTPIRIVLTTPSLVSASVIGGSRVTLSRLAGTRVDLSLAGPGAITASGVQADQLTVQLIGEGKAQVAGRAAKARLMANGSGSIDAAALDAGDLVAHLDGLGAIDARARYTAQVSSTGIGAIRVAGRPKCQVRAQSGGPITCGTADAR